MIKLDTIKLKLPAQSIKIVNANLFDCITKTYMNRFNLSETYSYYPKDIIGLKCIVFNVQSDTCIIDLSAKFLGDRYYELINRETINFLLKKLLSLKIISFNIKEFIEIATPLKLDVTNNIKVTEQIRNYIMFISYLPSKRNATITVYRNESIVLTNSMRTKRNKIRQIIYDKQIELNSHKKKENFCDFDRFEKVLRFETNLNSLNQIRKQIDLKSTDTFSLKSVLEKNTRVNYNIFHYFFPFDIVVPEVYKLIHSQETLSSIIKNYGQFEICKKFSFDFNTVKTFLRNKVKGNISNYLSDYERICNTQLNYISAEKTKNLYSEIESKLKVA